MDTVATRINMRNTAQARTRQIAFMTNRKLVNSIRAERCSLNLVVLSLSRLVLAISPARLGATAPIQQLNAGVRKKPRRGWQKT
mmetsp:Transcript_17911/g.55841  ORF Transcript_17911/g.55841 Transcript_17911/m.55841 type:complete len:84 (-) Transcript_17911:307-558(-)